MNKILRIGLLFLMLGLCMPAFSQISVQSFIQLDTDLDASTNFIKKDINGKSCAIIKIFTTQTGFSFDNGQLGIVAVEQKTAEIWVYVPEGTMKLKLSHQDLGHITNGEADGYYYFPTGRLKAGTVYKMDIISGAVRTYIEEAKVQTGFLVFKSAIDGVDVYLENENGEETHFGTTPAQKKMPYGRYNYRAKMFNYHDDVGVAVVDKSRVDVQLAMRPAFGSVSVNSTPSGARVFINGKDTGKKTPCVLNEVTSGSNAIRLSLQDYAPGNTTVTVSDGQTANVNMSLEPRFASVTINSLPGASIKVNGTVKGTSTYKANLSEGFYDIEITLASHETVTKQIEVVANMPQTIDLKPVPIYGTLDVISDPMDADITINGKSYGVTPITIDKILIGDYDVMLSKKGYASTTQRVTVSKGASASVDVKLVSGRTVNITTDKAGDVIYADGVKVGVSPCSAELTFGTHMIKAERAGKTTTKNVSVNQGVGSIDVRLGFGLLSPNWNSSVTQAQRTVLQRLIDNMVKVEGGSFTMGATSEQGGDAYESEKPAHIVTLSDYYIGKYEVTQEEWRAVMGNNPSYFKGDNLPVEQVCWNDCQEFIKKLNSMTGLNFSLPTEAQWEYAARGGKHSNGYKYSGSNNIDDVAWYSSNSSSQTHQVGTKRANELGLYDMSGNVYEWCQDWYGSYSSSSQTNPTGSSSGSSRVNRGGSWGIIAWICRVSFRGYGTPGIRNFYLGLRLSSVCRD